MKKPTHYSQGVFLGVLVPLWLVAVILILTYLESTYYA